MNPKQFLDLYTRIVFLHPLTGEPVNTRLTGYGSGWGPEKGCNRKDTGPKAQKEYAALKAALQKHLFGKQKGLPNEIYFDRAPLGKIDPMEVFYPRTFVHAFNGKGSPNEIIDTLRMALALGRIGSGRDAAGQNAAATTVNEYMDKFMTLDCNGLVGNYYGMRNLSDLSIHTFAKSSKSRKTIADVRPGDCIVTHSKDKPYEHIALVDFWQPTPTIPVNGKSQVAIRIVEWGQSGGESSHYTGDTPKMVYVGAGPEKSFGVAFTNDKGHHRYIFAPANHEAPNGWS